MDQPSSRQELYDRIRRSSKDQVILEEMIRLGFWPERGVLPEDPADEIRRRTDLESRLRALRTERTRLGNIEALKAEARKRRMAESRRKRQENKERRLRERAERAEAWRERKTRELTYLGDGVSAGLLPSEDEARVSDADKLARHGLPRFDDPTALAGALGISIGRLRRLAFSRTVAKSSHYVRFSIPKRTGGERQISAPMPQLKRAQRWILDNVLNKLPLHEAAHGFCDKRSIVTNARPHLGAAVLVNLDLRDFFPTVTYRRVKGLYRSLGYSEPVATVLALLCSEPPTTELELDGVTYYVSVGERVLPQGAPTSPAITNLLCRGLDARLDSVAKALEFRYTRYADDLSFSAAKADADAGRLLRRVHHVVEAEGFEVHPDKTRVLRGGRRQEVTGLVVNQLAATDGETKPRVPRATLRRFRATLYQVEKDGPAGKRWGQADADRGDDLIAAIEGFANYIAMVDPARGAPLVARAAELVRRHGKKAPPPRKPPGGGGGDGGPTSGTPRSESSTDPTSAPSGDPTPEPTEAPQDDAPKKKKNKKKWWKIL
jgi:RNA-directed DNA polymerase